MGAVMSKQNKYTGAGGLRPCIILTSLQPQPGPALSTGVAQGDGGAGTWGHCCICALGSEPCRGTARPAGGRRPSQARVRACCGTAPVETHLRPRPGGGPTEKTTLLLPKKVL